MRIFKRILFIIFIIAFVLSLCMNVILGISSTTLKLMFKDNMVARVQMYYTSTEKLINSEYLTISTSYIDIDNKKVVEKFSCKLTTGNTNSSYVCGLVSNQYDDKDNLIKTSYFPGDGYKYTIEGETKTKTADTSNYFSIIISGIYNNIYYLVQDYASPEEKNLVSYNTKINFDFNTFSFLKTVDVNLKENANIKNISYNFDSKDRLTGLTVNKSQKMTIGYNKTTIQFPSFQGYVEA